jgi:hypothetical protein
LKIVFQLELLSDRAPLELHEPDNPDTFVSSPLMGTPAMNGSEIKASAEANKQLIQASFDRWPAGTGGPFELLAADATWTITGNSFVAKNMRRATNFWTRLSNRSTPV